MTKPDDNARLHAAALVAVVGLPAGIILADLNVRAYKGPKADHWTAVQRELREMACEEMLAGNLADPYEFRDALDDSPAKGEQSH